MSNLSQFAPFAGGGLKSFQTGYVFGPGTVGTGEDNKFLDVTISSVTTAKSIPACYGSGSNASFGIYLADTTLTTSIMTPRLTSSTNIRLACDGFGSVIRMGGRWQVAEAN
jgi:hypothetical protein